ncbi:hypothetical protein ACFFRR_001264 [Megaselia abdita]
MITAKYNIKRNKHIMHATLSKTNLVLCFMLAQCLANTNVGSYKAETTNESTTTDANGLTSTENDDFTVFSESTTSRATTTTSADHIMSSTYSSILGLRTSSPETSTETTTEDENLYTTKLEYDFVRENGPTSSSKFEDSKFEEIENTSTEVIETTTEENQDKNATTPIIDSLLAVQSRKIPNDSINDFRLTQTEPFLTGQKKGKVMKDSNAEFNDLTLPGSADVWTLVGMKDNPVQRDVISNNSTTNSETSESIESKEEAIGTKNLSDWSKIMKEVYGLNETIATGDAAKNNSIEGDTLVTSKKLSETSTEGNLETIYGEELQNVLFRPPEQTQAFTTPRTTETSNVALITTSSSLVTFSPDTISTTEQLKIKEQRQTKVNIITQTDENNKESQVTTTVTNVKQENINTTIKQEDISTTSSNEYVTNEGNEEISVSSIETVLDSITLKPPNKLNSTLTTTELSSFPYEVNEIPENMNFTYSSHPESNNIITKSDSNSSNSNVIVAVSVSVTCVIIIALVIGFIYIMRKRQKQTSYSQRCRPVGLDAYSLDNVSVSHSMRRKGSGILRQSKRIYGNAAFDDPSLKHNILRAQDIIKFAEKRSSVYDEFRDVPQIIARSDEVPQGCDDLNRYANVIPLPETRVLLEKQGVDEKTEYINANYVRGPKDSPNYYIATQGPLDSTISDFWRMIWENNSRVILMATDLLENGIEKCAEYLPPSLTLDNHTVHGNFQITLKDREVKDKYAVSTVLVKNINTNNSREITHYWYKWPEIGVPVDGAPIIALLTEAKASLKQHASEASDTDTSSKFATKKQG